MSGDTRPWHGGFAVTEDDWFAAAVALWTTIALVVLTMPYKDAAGSIVIGLLMPYAMRSFVRAAGHLLKRIRR